MLKGKVFGRQAPGRGHKPQMASCDVLFSKVNRNGVAHMLSLRLSKDAMTRLRWLVGDYVRIRAEDEDGCLWRIERVPGPKECGIKITTGGKRAINAYARFRMERSDLDFVFRHDEPFSGTIVETDGNSALVLKD